MTSISVNHLPGILIAGTGFLADQFDLAVIDLVKAVMKEVPEYQHQSSFDTGLVSATALWGAVFGQLFFGTYADRIGRRAVFMMTASMVILGAIGSAFSWNAHPHFGVYRVLAVWRFILGFGVGGEYPLSATITTENSSSLLRGKMLACTFSLQGFGKLLCGVVTYALLQTNLDNNYIFRFILAFGAVPSATTFYFRWKMKESQEGKKAVERAKNRGQWQTLKMGFPYFWPLLFGTSINWFLQDITFYGNSLFSSHFTAIMGLGSDLVSKCKNSMYISLIALPGYFLTILLIDPFGRKQIQLFGYACICVIFLIMGLQFDTLKDDYKAIFLILFALSFTFTNFGPNGTTYIIPAEIYPPEIRGTFNGISAAAGKMGAAVTSTSFDFIEDAYGLTTIFFICSGVGVLGFLVTCIFTPNYTPVLLNKIDDTPGDRFERKFKKCFARAMPRYLPEGQLGQLNQPFSP